MKRETYLNVAMKEFVYVNMVEMRSQVLDSEESQTFGHTWKPLSLMG